MNILCKAVATAIALAASAPLAAQQLPLYPYDGCPEATVADMLDELVDNGPDMANPIQRDDVWATPSSTQHDAIEEGIRSLIQDPTTGAAESEFVSASMDICLAKSSASAPAPDTYIIYDPEGLSDLTSVGLPVMLYQPGVTDTSGEEPRVILSIPHAKTESHLDDHLTAEALPAEDILGNRFVRAAVISTVHRCHADTDLDPSGPSAPYVGSVSLEACEGPTGVRTMRLSDDAHNAESLFQTMHKELRQQFWDDQIVQIHGSGTNFPGISVSNGSGDQYNGPEADWGHAVVRWHDAFTYYHPGWDDITICHQYTWMANPPDYDERKCGTKNATRGEDPRLGADAAPLDPDDRYYHFVHLELNSGLKDSETDRAVIIESLLQAIPGYWIPIY